MEAVPVAYLTLQLVLLTITNYKQCLYTFLVLSTLKGIKINFHSYKNRSRNLALQRVNLYHDELNKQPKIFSGSLSLQHTERFNYSTARSEVNTPKSYSLSPYFITGFSDGEGSFSLIIKENSRFKTG